MGKTKTDHHTPKMNKNSIEKAFEQYDAGVRPKNHKPPKYWYVLKGDGQAYPAKTIWALATGIKPSDFNTRDARLGLADLDYSLVDVRTQNNTIDLFNRDLEKSAQDSSDVRRARLENYNKKPAPIFRLIKDYKRNPDVVAEVLARAKGFCEGCKCEAPFNKKKDGQPYLEVHHKIQLAHGGDDSVENAIALCPNCHRQQHHG